MDKLKVIKIGGNVLDNDKLLCTFLDDFSTLSEPKILVHGGGKLASELSTKLGLEVKMIEGRRITDEEAIKVVIQVYAGLINKTLVARTQALDCNSIGLTGADLNIIPAVKRDHSSIDFGYVGDFEPKDINISILKGLLDSGITPIFCSLTHDQKGQLLNTNADTIASGLAIALSEEFETDLTYCFDKIGVLSNSDDENSVIDYLNIKKYSNLKSTGAVHAGMLPKLDNAFNALSSGVSAIRIAHASLLNTNQGTTLAL